MTFDKQSNDRRTVVATRNHRISEHNLTWRTSGLVAAPSRAFFLNRPLHRFNGTDIVLDNKALSDYIRQAGYVFAFACLSVLQDNSKSC